MSLASGASVASSIKEYAFRGLQQLPLVLTAMSLLFTVTTASISYLNLLLGFVLIIPLYTTLVGALSEFALGRFLPGERFSWTRSSGDACRMVPPEGVGSLSLYESKTTSGTVVPSYWLMNITFFVGFVMSNLIDTFSAEPATGTDPAAVERRMLHATYVAVAFCLFVLGIAIARFRYMPGCEGRGWLGIGLSVLFAAGAGSIGYGMYTVSRLCGARSSDLLGILSQFVPPAAMGRAPIICSQSDE
jgi:hypothetical protein